MAAQIYQSLVNGLECLRMLASADGPVGSREMARKLGLEHTKVHRLLGTLSLIGLAEKTESGKYRPGPGIHVLAAQSAHGSRLLRSALPHLARLKQEGLMVALGVLWRGYVCYVYSSRPGEEFAGGVAAGALFPAEQSSIGLVMLAAAGGEGVRRFVEEARADGRDVRLKTLEGTLAEVRKRGFALIERDGGISMGVPVGKPPLAGLAFAGEAAQGRREKLLSLLREAANGIAEDMNTGGIS